MNCSVFSIIKLPTEIMKYYWQKQNRSEERKILRRSAVQEEDVAIRITHVTVAAVVIYRLSFHACMH